MLLLGLAPVGAQVVLGLGGVEDPKATMDLSGLGYLRVLLSPSLYCSLHDRPVKQETSCWGKE